MCICYMSFADKILPLIDFPINQQQKVIIL